MKTPKPLLNRNRKGKSINYSIVIGPELESEHPHNDELDWVRGYFKHASKTRFYLIEGDETAPIRIWEGDHNNITKFFKCVFEQDD